MLSSYLFISYSLGSTLLFSREGGLSDQGHGFSGIIARFESNHRGLFSADNLTNDEFEIDARFAQCFRYRMSETGFIIAFNQQSRNRRSAQAGGLRSLDGFFAGDRIGFNRASLGIPRIAVRHHDLQVDVPEIFKDIDDR